MDSTSNVKITFEEKLNSLVRDDYDVLYQLTQSGVKKGTPIEIVSDLPAAIDVDIILSYVLRWREVQKHFCSDLRIYAWSYNTTVEKYAVECVKNMPHIFITILPYELKENIKHGS